ncbi:MAG: hypothetical protein ACI85I_002563 [Arenicella sp.]|jgi:hypothetical protein
MSEKEYGNQVPPIMPREEQELQFPTKTNHIGSHQQEYCFEPFHYRPIEKSTDWGNDYDTYFGVAEPYIRLTHYNYRSALRNYPSSDEQYNFRICLRKIEYFDLEEPEFKSAHDEYEAYGHLDKTYKLWMEFSKEYLDWLKNMKN